MLTVRSPCFGHPFNNSSLYRLRKQSRYGRAAGAPHGDHWKNSSECHLLFPGKNHLPLPAFSKTSICEQIDSPTSLNSLLFFPNTLPHRKEGRIIVIRLPLKRVFTISDFLIYIKISRREYFSPLGRRSKSDEPRPFSQLTQ